MISGTADRHLPGNGHTLNWPTDLGRFQTLPGIILGMGLANERRHYIVMPSFIGWAHTPNDPWTSCWAHNRRVDKCQVTVLQIFNFKLFMKHQVLSPQLANTTMVATLETTSLNAVSGMKIFYLFVFFFHILLTFLPGSRIEKKSMLIKIYDAFVHQQASMCQWSYSIWSPSDP